MNRDVKNMLVTLPAGQAAVFPLAGEGGHTPLLSLPCHSTGPLAQPAPGLISRLSPAGRSVRLSLRAQCSACTQVTPSLFSGRADGNESGSGSGSFAREREACTYVIQAQ